MKQKQRQKSAQEQKRKLRIANVRAAVAYALLGAAVVVAATVLWIAIPLPRSMRVAEPVASVTLLDRNGQPLRATRSAAGERGGWLPIDAIDADIIRAFVAAEDQRFYRHHGVDLHSLARAARDNILHRRVVSGASTITMQTARMLRGTRRTWPGKVGQTLWALRLEAHLGKNEILERYLNRVPLGQGTLGVSAAASLYFGRGASDVSVGQAALLASFARRPARDNVIASAQRASARRAFVLQRMEKAGFITTSDVTAASNEPVRASDVSTRFLAPHFTTRVLNALPASTTGAITTTLDMDLQRAIEAEVRHTIAALQDRAASQAAVVVLDNRSGDVLAWVGSPDFFADTAGQVDMVVSRRQPGSALKPFLYGLAFDHGITAATVLPDVPHTYATPGGPYKPQNYDRRFRGPVRVREALASSFNIPAVELADRLGTSAFLRTLQAAGFESLSRTADHYGLGLALGNGDVSLIELANAYRGIANGGVLRPWRAQLRTTDAGPAQRTRFMKATSAALVLDILADPVARIPGFGTETPLDFPFRAAAKTGTSRHYTDNWAVATTAGFTVAVWVGNFSGRPMQKVSGITGAGPLLQRSVLEVAKRYAPGNLMDAESAGLVALPVCILSGMRATPECPSMIEWFTPGTEPFLQDTWQRGGRIALPAEYAEWSSSNSHGALTLSATQTIQAVGKAAGGAGRVRRILSPMDGDVYERPPGVNPRFASVALVASNDDERVLWRVDGKPLPRNRWEIASGAHVIVAEWPDGARDSVRVRGSFP